MGPVNRNEFEIIIYIHNIKIICSRSAISRWKSERLSLYLSPEVRSERMDNFTVVSAIVRNTHLIIVSFTKGGNQHSHQAGHFSLFLESTHGMILSLPPPSVGPNVRFPLQFSTDLSKFLRAHSSYIYFHVPCFFPRRKRCRGEVEDIDDVTLCRGSPFRT